MRTYRELFSAAEFTPLFLASSVQVAAQTLSGLALGTLIYAATRSPLLSALSMFGPSLAQVAGAATLLSAAGRMPPRAALGGVSLAFGLGTAALAVPGLPAWGAFAIVPAPACISRPRPSPGSASAAVHRVPPGGRRSPRPGGTTRGCGPLSPGATSISRCGCPTA